MVACGHFFGAVTAQLFYLPDSFCTDTSHQLSTDQCLVFEGLSVDMYLVKSDVI